MQNIKAITACLCFVLIICGLAKGIAPSGNIQKTLKIVISIFCLFCLLTAIIETKKDIDLENIKVEFYQNQTTKDTMTQKIIQETIQYSEKEIKEKIYNTLIQNEIQPKEIIIELESINNKIEITRSQIIIQEQDQEKTEEIKTLINESLGINVTVIT